MWYQSQFILLVLAFLVILALYTIVKIFDILVMLKNAIVNGPFVPQQIFYGIFWSSIDMVVIFDAAPVAAITILVTIWAGVILRIYCAKKHTEKINKQDV